MLCRINSVEFLGSLSLLDAVKSLFAIALLLSGSRLAFAQEATSQPKPDASVSQAAIAYQLAIQGQRSKSPVLMLAAIEMIGVLKTGDAPADLKKEGKQTSNKPAQDALTLDVSMWPERARDYAKDDKKLLAFVEDRIEKLGSRDVLAPAGSYQKFFGGTRYTVLDSGFIGTGDTAILRNIQVAGGKFACVGVIGEIDSDLFFQVIDDTGNKQGGESFRGLCIYSWTPARTHACALSVTNSGKPCAYVIVGH